MNNPLPKLIVIVGPTASGKTDLAIKIAKKFGGEVISADSRQTYKEFTVGTGKPPGKWMRKSGRQVYVVDGVTHHLMDEIDPKEEFTLVDFKKRSLEKIEETLKKGRLPLLVGGTALYVYSIIDNLIVPEIPPQAAFRARMAKKTTEELLAELTKKDPESAKITGKNKRRIIRALEVIEKTGKKFSTQRGKGPKLFNNLLLGVKVEKENLGKKIEKRVGEMMKEGLLEEVRVLAKKYSWDIPPMQSIDYQEFREYLENKESLEKALERIIAAHKGLARRQMTWFGRDENIRWVKDYEETEKLVDQFVG